MHGDLESFFGVGHEFVHSEHFVHSDHELPHVDAVDDALSFALGALPTLGVHLSQSLHNHFSLHEHIQQEDNQPNIHSHDSDLHNALSHDQHIGPYINPYPADTRIWHDTALGAHPDLSARPGLSAHDVHLHLLKHSEAQDSNGDGISDAASKDIGIDPYAANAHHVVNLNWHGNDGHWHHSHGKDSDGDGWSDDLERLAGTDPYNAASHPSLVEAHHYPAGSDENLPGTFDASASTMPWQSI